MMPLPRSAAHLLRAPSIAFIAALLLRVAAVFTIGHYRNPTLWENGTIAQYLLQGCGFCMDFSRAGELSSWQAPGYPFLLFVAWRVFGRGAAAHLAISLAQAVVLASMVFPLRWLTLRWFGERAATAAMWIACVMPLYVWYATRLHQAGLVMAAHPWLVWLWLRLRRRPSRIDVVAAGIAAGVAGLFQPILLLLAAVIGIGLAFHAARRSSPEVVAAVLGAGLVATLVITPWTVRNYAVHGRLVPIRDSFGKEFWMGNNPHATGTSFAEGGTTEITYAFPPRAFALRGQVPEIELMDAMSAEALDYVREYPGAFVARTGKKIAWFWTTTPSSLVRSSLGGEALRFRWLHLGYWLTFLACAVLAVFQRRSLPREYAALLAVYVVTYSLLYGITHVGQARYRGEMEFILIPLVATGLAVLWTALSARFSVARTPTAVA